MENKEAITKELYCQYLAENDQSFKDIVIVIHDQVDYVKKCFDSIYQNTKNFILHIWDNNSMPATRDYLRDFHKNHDNTKLIRCPENVGFIKPNNILVKRGQSPYIILLNSDTEVYFGWDTALIGWLKSNPDYKLVGYEGGLLEENGYGSNKFALGDDIDYISGWCMCFERDLYNKYGLFDEEHLSFAYGEDSDFSLRLKEKEHKIYALHLNFIKHHGNITSKEVAKEMDTSINFKNNHQYIQKKYKKYLCEERMLLKNSLELNDELL